MTMERRDFLKSLGLAGASVLVPVSSASAQRAPDVWEHEYTFPQPTTAHSLIAMYLDLLEGFTHDVAIAFHKPTHVFGIRTLVEPYQVVGDLRVNGRQMWMSEVDMHAFNTDDCWCPLDLPVGPLHLKLQPQQDVLMPLIFVVSPFKTMQEQMEELKARGINVTMLDPWKNSSRGWFGAKPESLSLPPSDDEDS